MSLDMRGIYVNRHEGILEGAYMSTRGINVNGVMEYSRM